MRVIKHQPQEIISAERPYIAYFFADTHFGNHGFRDGLLKKHIQMCKDHNAGWFHLGDWCEYITPNDKRYTAAEPAPNVEEQKQMAKDYFEPIKEQGIAVLSGNHENSIARFYGDPMTDIANTLGVPYLGYSGFVHLMLKTSSTQQKAFTIFLHHGHGGGMLYGGKLNNLHRLSHKFEADVYGIGHVHTWSNPIDEVIGIKTSGLRHPKFLKKRRQYFSCPSYFDPYVQDNGSNYAQRAALYPQPCGCVRMTISFSDNAQWNVKLEPVLE